MNNLFKIVEIKNVVLAYKGSYENLIKKGFEEVNDLLKNHLYKKFYINDSYVGIINVDNNIITIDVDNAEAKEILKIENATISNPIKLIELLNSLFSDNELELKQIVLD